jgi:hypothetical protein
MRVRIPVPLPVNSALTKAIVPLYTVATPLVPYPLSTEPSAFSRTSFAADDGAWPEADVTTLTATKTLPPTTDAETALSDKVLVSTVATPEVPNEVSNEPVAVYFVTVASGVVAEEAPATNNVPDGPSDRSAPDPESVSVPDVPNEESREPVEEIFTIFVVDVEPEDPRIYRTSTESPTEIICAGYTKLGCVAESRVRIPFVPNEVTGLPFDENFMTTADRDELAPKTLRVPVTMIEPSDCSAMMLGPKFCIAGTSNPPIPFVPNEVSSEPSTLYRTKRTLPVNGDAVNDAVAATRICPDRVTVPVAGPTEFELSPIDRDPPLPNEVSKVTAVFEEVGAPRVQDVCGPLGPLGPLGLDVPPVHV